MNRTRPGRPDRLVHTNMRAMCPPRRVGKQSSCEARRSSHRGMGIGVRRAESADLASAAEVLGRAFADYPWTRWTVDSDDHVRRVTELQRLAMESFGHPYGQVWVAVDDGAILSVAVWMDSRVVAPDEVSAASRAAARELEGVRHEASLAAENEISAWRPDEAHYYLAAVGTDPSVQRRGLAAKVLRPVLAAADEEGTLAYLETSSESNVALYSRLGFTVTAHFQIAGGGPDVWAMSRQPRRTRNTTRT